MEARFCSSIAVSSPTAATGCRWRLLTSPAPSLPHLGLRDQLRARPNLAGDQDGAICRRNTWHLHQRGRECRRGAKNLFVPLRAVGVLLKTQGPFPDTV